MVYKGMLGLRSCCYLCGAQIEVTSQHRHICAYCLEGLQQEAPACFRCGIALQESGSASIHSTYLHCGDCLVTQPVQYRSVCGYSYRFPLPELIGELKFKRQTTVTPLLTELFVERCKQAYKDDVLPELIVPVPLHARRAFSRGFNQAELLAVAIGRQLSIKVLRHGIYKVRSSPSQMSLSIEQRQRNMQAAFELASKLDLSACKHIALFDDVMTTGATLNSLAAALSGQGIARIDYWTLTRTPKLNQ